MRRKQKIIFIVDDNEYNLKAINQTIKNETRSKTFLFNDPKAAIVAIEKHTPDLILTDYSLESDSITGEELLLEVKKNHPNIRVLVYSSNFDKFLAFRLIAEGAEDFVPRSNSFYEEIGPISSFHLNRARYPYHIAKAVLFSTLILALAFFVLISSGVIESVSLSIVGSIILLGISVFFIESITRNHRSKDDQFVR